jgi:hypothetical protein
LINLEIKFDQADVRRVLRAFRRIERAVDREKKELPYRCAVEYVNLLRGNIMTQKFAGGYAPYHPRYANWKAQYFASSGYWVMRGTVVNSLTVYRDRHPQRWVGGIRPNAGMVPGSSWFGPPGRGKPKSINMYAYVNEYGGNYVGANHPARPVFRPTKKEYERGGFPKRGRESLDIIGRSWR